MFLKRRQSISSVSGSVRLWKFTPRHSIARSEFGTSAAFNSGKKFLKRLYDSQFEADGTPVARRKPKNPNPSSIKKSLADQLRLQGYVVEDGLPPLTLLHQAEKSGALNIGANDALGIVHRYIQIAGTKEGLWEADFCTEEKIQASTLRFLSLVLSKCLETPRRVVAKSLLLSASRLLDPTATITILEAALKENALHQTEAICALATLEVLAKQKNNPAAMVLLGNVYERQKKDDAALDMYRRAHAVAAETPAVSPAATGASSTLEQDPAGAALMREGLLLLRRDPDDAADARAALRAAAVEHDNAAAYYRLAGLEGALAPSREDCLLKAAASGIVPACHDLGVFYARRSASLSGAGRAWNVAMAKEWLTLAVAAGNAESWSALQELPHRHGDADGAAPWLAPVLEDSPGPDVQTGPSAGGANRASQR